MFIGPQSTSADSGNIALGDQRHPYTITTCEDLQNIANENPGSSEDLGTPNSNVYYELTGNIDCTGSASWNSNAGFIPITNFNGNLIGNGYAINGLTIDEGTSNTSSIGLFSTTSNATISHLTLSNVNITSDPDFGSTVGALIGGAVTTNVTDVQVSGTVTYACNSSTTSSIYVGGIEGGAILGGAINNSSSTATLSSTQDCSSRMTIGGLVGASTGDLAIQNSYNQGDITAPDNNCCNQHILGGLIGIESVGGDSSTITKSYNDGQLRLTGTNHATGSYDVGGLVGAYNANGDTAAPVTINDSFNAGFLRVPLPCVSGCNGMEQTVGAMVGQTSNDASSVPSFASDYYDQTASRTTLCDPDNNLTCNAVDVGGSDINYFNNNDTNPPFANNPADNTSWDFDNTWATTTNVPVLQPYVNPDPDPPTNLLAVPGDAGANLTWDAPTNTGDSPISQYNIQYEVANSNSWTVVTSSGSGTSFNLIGLIPNTQYTIEVYAQNSSNNVSLSSAPVSIETSSATTVVITTCQQLQNMANDLGANYIIGQNINCSATSGWNGNTGFIPIGTGDAPFVGSLNGNGHTISGLFDDHPNNGGSDEAGGIFAYIQGATISNLTLLNPTFSSGDVGASIADYDLNGSIANVHVVNGSLTLDSPNAQYAGGLVGFNFGGTISQSSYAGTITSEGEYTGGIAGVITNTQDFFATITNSYSQAAIVQQTDNQGTATGGLVGASIGIISNSYASGSIASTGPNANSVGGIAGFAYTINDGGEGMTNDFSHTSLATTGVSGSLLGGIVGSDSNGTGLPNTSDYFDATLAGTTACSGDSDDSCSVVNIGGSQPNYFYDNNVNPPMHSWNFTTIWGTTTQLPDLVPNSAVTPLALVVNPASIKHSTTPTTTPTTGHGLIPSLGTLKPPTTPTTGHAAAMPATTESVPSSGIGAIIGSIKHFIAHLPKGVVVAFPFLLYGLLFLAGLAALIELSRELRRLRLLQLLIDKQKKLAEERDTFWHLAANYLRAPITLLIGGAEALADAKKDELSATIQSLAQRLQSKVSGIMKQAEHSQDLLAIAQPPRAQVGRRLLTSARFWLPVAAVAVLASFGDIVAINFRHIDSSIIVYGTQTMVFILAVVAFYWTLSLLQRGRQKRQDAELLLHRQEHELAEARESFIAATATGLEADVALMEKELPLLPATSPQLPTLQEGTRRLRQMITTFQLLTKVEALPLKPGAPIVGSSSLNNLLSQATHEQSTAIAAKGLRFTTSGIGELVLPGSPELLGQVVSSVVANAVAFSPKYGAITITATPGATSTTLTVADQGDGIATDQLEHLFQPFVKADGSDALELNHDGIGLNLYLDKIIMEQLGGTIAATSEAGRGTTVTMTWPAALGATQPLVAGQPAMVYPQDYRP